MKYHYNYTDQYHEGPNIVRFLTDDGLDAQLGGETNMVGAWLGQKKKFWVEAQRGEQFALKHAIIHMKITGPVKGGGYGSGLPLVNGISVYFYSAGFDTYFDILDTEVIRVNEDWGKHDYNTELTSYDPKQKVFKSHWDFTEDGGPVLMNSGDRIEVVLDDNIDSSRGITEMVIKVAGILLSGSLEPAVPQP